MKHELQAEAATGPVLIPGVVSLSPSSRRTLKHGDSFAMFDEFGDVVELEHSPAGLFHFDTRHLSRFCFTLEGHRALCLSSTVQPDNLTLDVDLTCPDIFQGDRLVLAKDTFHVSRAKFLWQAGCYELFTLTEEVRSLILRRASARDIRRLAIEGGMVTLRVDGWLRACEGVTTIEEVLRVTQEDA